MEGSSIWKFLAVYLLLLLVGVVIAFGSCAQQDGAELKASDAAAQADASAAATGENNAPDQGEASTTADPASAPADPAPAPEAPTPANQATSGPFTVSLGFAGDICFADNYLPQQHLDALGSTKISDGIDQRYIDLMHSMDLMWLNNEFVYSTRGEPLEGKMWTFRSKPEHVSYLRDLGVDIVGLANNHTYDYGKQAFLDTIGTLEASFVPYVGAGRTLERAMQPVILEAGGLKIAYVAASRAEYSIYTPEATETEPGILWCYDNEKFLQAIRTAAEQADYVVALPHWGIEHSTELEAAQTEGARAYIDAGADAVIGAHTHILQGIEFYQGKPIFYSLGNFWFDDYDIDTAVAELRLSATRDDQGHVAIDPSQVQLVVHPGTQSQVFTSFADTPTERDRIFRYLEGISLGVTIDQDGVVHPAA